ncbi:MAG TPA: MXAN_6640 family putative metalloprotease [Nocardioidaceae bacterium]|nr:MXAN_6640 family putative metalloprotease [Nocardioidaceae bacterium]
MRLKYFAAVVASCALVVATPAYGASRADTEQARPTAAQGRAQAALERVQELFAEKPNAGLTRATGVIARGDATMALRDLKFSLDELSGADRVAAERLLARPTDGGSDPFGDGYTVPEQPRVCGVHVCIHYVLDSPLGDQPPIADVNLNLIPDQVELARDTAEFVWSRIVTQGGYLAPLPDDLSETNGGGAEFDIYLSNLTNNGLYGYCTTDDPDKSDLKVSAYCVIDNDFVGYPLSPLASLQVTVAHEFFHAVQFAYEALEDDWFMESTAAWIEDELYDSINDNMQYIRPASQANPFSTPTTPLDFWDYNEWPSYGGWAFWKKLTETFSGQAGTGLPVIMREVWTAAGNPNPGGASTMALTKVLAQHNASFGKFFHKWGVGNRFPAKSYSEGKANHYPKARLGGRYFLSKSKRNLGWKSIELFHMSNINARMTPQSSLSGKAWKLRVTVNNPAKMTSPFASLVLYKKSGKIQVVPITLNRKGNGVKTVPFGRGSVKYVELTMSNASNRFKGCYPVNLSNITCGGKAIDDKLLYAFKAEVVR